jgi:citrate synthase
VDQNTAADTGAWLTADEVASRLNVKRETVYAYVSRGRLASRRESGGRGSVFDPVDVERLAARSQRGGRSGSTQPESELTLIENGELYYRGFDARTLAQERSFEDVAELLWGSDGRRGNDWQPGPFTEALTRSLADLPPVTLAVDQLKIIASSIGALDVPFSEADPDVVAASARRLLMTMIGALPSHSEVETWPAEDPRGGRVVPFLWSRLCPHLPSVEDLRTLSTAMILDADHDLATATVAVRTAARAGVDPGGIVRLGMDVGRGPVKGAAGLAIEAFLRAVESPDHVEAALTGRLRQGEPIPGFGHAMYPDGDPRASAILDALRASGADPQRLQTVDEVVARQLQRGLPPPNAGFAIAALSYVTDMIPGAGEVIFVIARAVGWIAHALEEYGREPLPRQHSLYVGPMPRERAS